MIFGSEEMWREVANGTSYVCAMCKKYWEGKELRKQQKKLLNIVRDDQLCTATSDCGSPFGGRVFEEYDGPLQRFESCCFVCGSRSKFAVRVRNLVRVVGVCENHVTWFKHFKTVPKGKQALAEDWRKREIKGDDDADWLTRQASEDLFGGV